MWGILVMLAFLAASCSTGKNYQRAYRRAWRNIVNSQAWRDALVYNHNNTADAADVYHPLPGPSHMGNNLGDTGFKIDEAFLETYRSLVFRAYFRTIADAEKADARIYEAYRNLREQRPAEGRRKDPAYREELAHAKTRYQAHRRMLEGLKSWKAFNEYGSNDLDFFLEEQLPHAYHMHRQGKSDADILRYLVYRLADLYHFEEPDRD